MAVTIKMHASRTSHNIATVLKLLPTVPLCDASRLHTGIGARLHAVGHSAECPCISNAVFSLAKCVLCSQVLDGHDGRYAAEQGSDYLKQHMLELVQSGLDFPTVLVSAACT